MTPVVVAVAAGLSTSGPEGCFLQGIPRLSPLPDLVDRHPDLAREWRTLRSRLPDDVH